MTIAQVVFTLITIFASSLVQGTLGFGFALLAVPALTVFLPVSTVTPMIVFCCLLNNSIIVFSNRTDLKLREIRLLILFGIIGTPLGVYALKHFDQSILKLGIGLVIIITGLAMVRGTKVKFKNKLISYGVTGLISGMLNGGLAMSGPPLVLFLTNEGYEKNSFKANIMMYGIITNLVAIFNLGLEGLIDFQVIKITGICLTLVVLGSLCGLFISKQIAEAAFRKLILWVLIIMGLSTVFNAFKALPF